MIPVQHFWFQDIHERNNRKNTAVVIFFFPKIHCSPLIDTI